MSTLGLADLCPDARQLRCFAVVFSISVIAAGVPVNGQTPAKGETAPDFTLSTISGTPGQLSAEARQGITVLVILGGYPGFQCQFCQEQAHDFIFHAAEFAKRKTTVGLVYAGPPAPLDQHAREFLSKQVALPPNITLVTDPGNKVKKSEWRAVESTRGDRLSFNFRARQESHRTVRTNQPRPRRPHHGQPDFCPDSRQLNRRQRTLDSCPAKDE